MLLIRNAHIKPIVGEEIMNGCILTGDDGKIAAIGQVIDVPAGAQVIDAGGRLVSPGLIDAHSHIGMRTAGLHWEGIDHNEDNGSPVMPHMRSVDSLYPQDEYFPAALQGGVTAACTGPGARNVVGGTFAVIKLFGNRIDDMILKFPAAMKCSLGEVPKNAHGQAGRAPKTRMGSAAILRELLFQTQEYCESKDSGKSPKYDEKLEAMLPVIRRQIPLKCHVHRCDDILTAIRIAKEFNLKLTIDHCTDGIRIMEHIVASGYPVIVGPTMSGITKPELANKSFDLPKVLQKEGVLFCITADSPVIALEYLHLCAGMAISYGLPKEEAWKAITINPATILDVQDRVGSLEVGKDADIVIWHGDPLKDIGSKAWTTIIDGKIVHSMENQEPSCSTNG